VPFEDIIVDLMQHFLLVVIFRFIISLEILKLLKNGWISAIDNPRYPKGIQLNALSFVLICSKHFELSDFHICEPSASKSRTRRKLKQGRILLINISSSR